MVEQAEDSEVRVRLRGKEMSLAVTEEQAARMKATARHTVSYTHLTLPTIYSV